MNSHRIFIVVALCLCLTAFASADEHDILRGVKTGEEVTARGSATADKPDGDPIESNKQKNTGASDDEVKLAEIEELAELARKRAGDTPTEAQKTDEEIQKLLNKKGGASGDEYAKDKEIQQFLKKKAEASAGKSSSSESNTEKN